MPIYNTYPLIPGMSDADIILVWQAAASANKTILFEDFSDSVEARISPVKFSLNFTALRLVSVVGLATGAMQVVSGYSAINDGGGGIFTYSASSAAADNDGTVISPASAIGRWLRVYSGPVNVKWFGAKGDGVVDDTAPIQSAIAATGANNVTLFPAGQTFKTTTQIDVPYSGMVLSGYGATITSATEAQYQKFKFESKSGGGVEGIKFNCLYAAMATGIGKGVVEIKYSSDIIVKDCEFNDVAQSGVFLLSTSTRCNIENNKFYRNFCGIFSDDDTVNEPTLIRIVGNRITTGLGGTGTALSGGIKMSGIGDVNSLAGHIISENVIEFAGQMGIETQEAVNGLVISNNRIVGTGFGISVSICANTEISSNTIKQAASWGIEVASNSIRVAVTGNVVDGRNAAGASVTPDGVLISSSSLVSVTGLVSSGCSDKTCNIADSNNVTVTGCVFGGSTFTIKNSSKVVVSSNMFQSEAGANYFIFVDSTNTNVSDLIISSNYFNGNINFVGILLYHPGNIIQDVTIEGNRLNGDCPGWALGETGAGASRRIRCRNNYGDGGQNFRTNMGIDLYKVAVSTQLDFTMHGIEVDATSGVKTITLPDAANMTGEEFFVVKTDAFNNVTVATTGGQTINGAATFVLAAQYKRVTVQSDGTNWMITQSN